MAVRTTEPRVTGLAIDARVTVPPALMSDLLGVSIASQAIGLIRSASGGAPDRLRSTLDVGAARSLVRVDTPPTRGRDRAGLVAVGGVLHRRSDRGRARRSHRGDRCSTPTTRSTGTTPRPSTWRSTSPTATSSTTSRSGGPTGTRSGSSSTRCPWLPASAARSPWSTGTGARGRHGRSGSSSRSTSTRSSRATATCWSSSSSKLDEDVSGGSRNTTWGVGRRHRRRDSSGRASGIFGGVAGRVSGSSSSAWQDSARTFSADSMQQLRDRVSQRASSMRSERSTVVQTVGQGESFRAETEVVANYNRCHAITDRVLRGAAPLPRHPRAGRRQGMPVRPASRSRCSTGPRRCAGVSRWPASSARAPPGRVRRDRADRRRLGRLGLPRRPPTARRRPESIEGELRISFLLPRPRDDVDGAFQIDTWAALAPFLDVDPLELFTAKLNALAARQRDRVFREEIAPGIAERLVQRLRLAFVTSDGGEIEVPIDATLVSRYAEGTPLYVTLNPAGGVPPLPEARHRPRQALVRRRAPATRRPGDRPLGPAPLPHAAPHGPAVRRGPHPRRHQGRRRGRGRHAA